MKCQPLIEARSMASQRCSWTTKKRPVAASHWEMLPTRNDHVGQLFFMLTAGTRRGELDRFFSPDYTNSTITVPTAASSGAASADAGAPSGPAAPAAMRVVRDAVHEGLPGRGIAHAGLTRIDHPFLEAFSERSVATAHRYRTLYFMPFYQPLPATASCARRFCL